MDRDLLDRHEGEQRMRIREHRAGLAESLLTVQEIRDRTHLVETLQTSLAPSGFRVDATAVHVEPYTFDPRIGWNTHLITIDGYGVWGMADGPIPVEAGENGRTIAE